MRNQSKTQQYTIQGHNYQKSNLLQSVIRMAQMQSLSLIKNKIKMRKINLTFTQSLSKSLDKRTYKLISWLAQTSIQAL